MTDIDKLINSLRSDMTCTTHKHAADALTRLQAENAELRQKCDHIMQQHGERLEEVARLREDAEEFSKLVPRTPQEIIDFIGNNFNSMQTRDGETPLPLDLVCYSVTVHDLLSAFSWSGLQDAARLPQS